MNPRIYLSPPHLQGNEGQRLQEVLASNWIAPLGPEVDAFEREMALFLGVQGALALSSGTAAIHLGLKLLGVQPGDEVLCSSLTFVASANPILYEGAIPVFIDSEDETWNLSPLALRNALEDSRMRGVIPRAVVVASLYGQSAQMEKIRVITDEFEVPILEDAAESLGAVRKDRMSGSFGDFSVLSFNGNKIITTSGGGMLVSDEVDSLEKARFWSTQAREPVRHYEHREMGYNYRMSNLLASLGRSQLSVLADRIAARRKVFARYESDLADLEGISFMPEAVGGRGTRWLSVILVGEGGPAPIDLILALEKQNIEARPVWKPLHQQPLFAGRRFFRHADKPISEVLFERGVCLPSGSSLSDSDQDRIIETIRKAWCVAKTREQGEKERQSRPL